MCDEQTLTEAKIQSQSQPIRRRTLGKMGVGLALAAMLPRVASAQDVVAEEVTVTTPDGEADCYFVRPTLGSHPAVIFWPDIFGVRESSRQMATRLAESGYAVLVVNPYYRTLKGEFLPEGTAMIDSEMFKQVLPEAYKLARTLSPETCVRDGRAFVNYLDAQPAVNIQRKIGVMGYCMTGSYSFRLAAAMPERIGAGASFHGANLVTEDAASPHRLIPQIKAGMLVAIAEDDDAKEPDTKHVLRKAFDEAGVTAEVEVYEGAKHGWCPPDMAMYDPALAERAWKRMLTLYSAHLS